MNSTKNKAGKKNLTPAEAQDALNEIMLHGESTSGVTQEEALEILENASDEQLQSLSGGEYLRFNKEATHHLVFTGMDKAVLEAGTDPVDVVKLRDKEGKEYISGAAIVVNSLKKVTQLPCYVRIIVSGEKKKSANGEYYDLKVLTFPTN